MKLALAVHAWPRAGSGGVERSVRVLAGALAQASHDLCVLAGSLEPAAGGEVELRGARVDLADGANYEFLELRRPDLYFDPWHKSRPPAVAARVPELLAERGVEVRKEECLVKVFDTQSPVSSPCGSTLDLQDSRERQPILDYPATLLTPLPLKVQESQRD